MVPELQEIPTVAVERRMNGEGLLLELLQLLSQRAVKGEGRRWIAWRGGRYQGGSLEKHNLNFVCVSTADTGPAADAAGVVIDDGPIGECGDGDVCEGRGAWELISDTIVHI